MKVAFLAIAFLLGAFEAQAARRLPVANYMTCAQAINYYEKHQRIYVVANGKDIVPIYGFEPASKWRGMVCTGRSKGRKSYWVKTTDNKTCVIGIYCG